MSLHNSTIYNVYCFHFLIFFLSLQLTNGVRGNGDGAEKESLEDESSATITVVTHNGTTAEIQNQVCMLLLQYYYGIAIAL